MSNVKTQNQNVNLKSNIRYRAYIFSLSIMRYMIHGVFEIIAYFIGGLAGGIISIGIINHGANTKKFKNVMFDALILMLIAIILLVVGALVEVFITPLLF